MSADYEFVDDTRGDNSTNFSFHSLKLPPISSFSLFLVLYISGWRESKHSNFLFNMQRYFNEVLDQTLLPSLH